MRVKLVYVLVSEATDYYYEMFVMSLYTFRLYHPSDTVYLVMDDNTHRRLVRERSTILEDVVPVPVSVPSEYTIMQRSRYLKTNLRQIVKGDLLYIDGDTFICESLGSIDNISGDIAMVTDLHRDNSFISPTVIERSKKAGFDYTGERPYYNSGVALIKDSSLSDQLFKTWFDRWKQSVANGVPQDQPALCQANLDLGCPIQPLPGIWNCQISMGKNYLHYFHHAKILHYFNANGWGKTRIRLMERVKKRGIKDWYVIFILRYPRVFVYPLIAKTFLRDNYYRIREVYFHFFHK